MEMVKNSPKVCISINKFNTASIVSICFIILNRVHQNVSLHISFLIFYGSLIGCIILLPQEVVL